MLELAAMVLGLALFDCINPSAIIVTILLIAKGDDRKIPVYVAAIFCTYLAMGILLMFGLSATLTAVGPQLESPIAYGVQAAVGLVMLLYGIFASSKARKGPKLPSVIGMGAISLLGIMVTIAELPTAIPYLGAIGIMTGANLGASTWLPLLVAYNVIFVLPPLAIWLGYRALGSRLTGRLDKYREKLQQGARETWLTIVAIIGFFLLAQSGSYFAGILNQ
jgi:Protein of unknown function (DUF2910).